MKRHSFDAVIFDLDGVITKTALVHASAWKEMFDEYLRKRELEHGEPFSEFTHAHDYLSYVDGKPRYKGVESFLESRGIKIPYGTPEDAIDKETICGLGNRKNMAFNKILQRDGVEVYESTVVFMDELRKAGIPLGVASSSKNCRQVLERAGLLHYFDTRVDGEVSAEMGLHGKPEPDIFTVASDNLKAPYDRVVVVEDAVSGVQAGKKGNFGLVIGVAREDNAYELKYNGADIVVADIEELGGIRGVEEWFEEGLAKDMWTLRYSNYDITREKSREALLTVGNGYFGTRGALEESEANEYNYPGTYMAGLYNRLKTQIDDRIVENEDLVNAPNWLPITFKVGEGEWFDPNKEKILEIERSLNLLNGVLSKKMLAQDSKGNITLIESTRLASMANKHRAAINYSITPQNYTGYIRIKSRLSVPLKNEGVKRYGYLNQHHTEPMEQGGNDSLSFVAAKTTQSGIVMAVAAQLAVYYNERPMATNFVLKQDEGWVNTYIKAEIKKGETYRIEKLVSICNSLSGGIDDPIAFVQHDAMSCKSFDEMLAGSAKVWEDIWRKVDVKVTGDRLAQKLLRLHIYHTLVTTSPHSTGNDFGIPARGLHGEEYRGHILWDELFIFPFFCLHYPEIAKSVLMYRYRRLSQARENAKGNGLKGAMFPWQSGSDGREETLMDIFDPQSGEWSKDYSSLQRHVSLAIAYNVWNYFNITGDIDFMNDYGSELFFDICRFWSSIAKLDPKTNRYSIEGVVGPDVYHQRIPGVTEAGVKDNAYTNIMVVWLFKRAFDLMEAMGENRRKMVLRSISLQEEELELWRNQISRMNLSISPEGVLEQFEGFFSLKEIDWNTYREKLDKTNPLHSLLKSEGKATDVFKVCKQADALMIFFNILPAEVMQIIQDLGYTLPTDYLKNNFEYYYNRCAHSSSLAALTHAYVAALAGMNNLSRDLYQKALKFDYNDEKGNTTAEGIHLGAMTGAVMMTLTAFAGLNYQGDLLSISPNLPKPWRSIEFSISFKGEEYCVCVKKEQVKIKRMGTPGESSRVVINGKEFVLTADREIVVNIS